MADLLQSYSRIEKRLEKLDFPALFRGFSRFPFSLYDDTHALIDEKIVEKPVEFLANTSIRYEGKYIAIWKLMEENGDDDVLTSKIVHEMFHAFQNASGETRWADERGALVKYRYDATNISARLEEAACMRECLAGQDRGAFEKLLSLRKARQERFPFEFDYESRIEQIEGTANYVELLTLNQLDAGKAKRAWERLFAELSEPQRYYPARSVTYLSGAAFLACLYRYTNFDTDSFTDIPFAAAVLEGAKPCPLPGIDPRVESCLSDKQKQAQAIVDKALAKGDIALDGNYRMIAWNVYDASWDGKYAILTHFLGYFEGAELPATDEELFASMKVVNGNFVAEVNSDLCLSKVWRL